jgi:hypothetical protein
MIQTRAVQSLADAHRRDLLASAGRRRGGGPGAEGSVGAGAMPPSEAGRVASRGPGGHRALAPRLGAWLIEFGTKLGGATIRTS